MRFRSPGPRLPAPLGDMLVFAATVAGFLVLWRLSGSPIDCSALAGAVGCAVGLGWLDSYRRARGGTPPRAASA
jgi:hypothetical protein